MKPLNTREVKEQAAVCDCPPCRAITEQGMYIGRPSTGTGQTPVLRRHLVYGPKPCQAGADCKRNRAQLPVGAPHVWVRTQGVWHPECFQGEVAE